MGDLLKNHYKSPFTAINFYRHYEPVVTDTIYSDTPDIYGGSEWAQLFFVTNSPVSYVYGMKIDKQFVNTL